MSNFDDLADALGENDAGSDIRWWVNTGFIPLNYATSGRYDGGLPCGRVVEVYGPESSGKTWLATECMKSAQQAGGIACFHDHERSFKLSLGISNGLSDARGKWVYRKPATYEESISIFIKNVQTIREKKVIPPEAPIVYVFDSLASMTPKKVLDGMATGLKMDDKLALASVTSLTFPVIAAVADTYNVLVIFLNQIRLQPGVMYGDPTTTPGGKAPKFYASIRIQLGASRLTKDIGGEKEMIGSEVTARCIKNKTNRPFLKAKWRFTFRADGSGYFDVVGGLVDFAKDRGVLTYNKPRFVWTDGKQYFRDALVEKIEREGLRGELERLIIASGVVPEEEVVDEMEAGDVLESELAA